MATKRSSRPRLPAVAEIDPKRLLVMYFERVGDLRHSFYLLIGMPGLAPAIAVSGTRSELGRSIFGGGRVYIKDDLIAEPRAFRDFVRELDVEGADSSIPRENPVRELRAGRTNTLTGQTEQFKVRLHEAGLTHYRFVGGWDPYSDGGTQGALPSAFSPRSANGRSNLAQIWERALVLVKKSPSARMKDNGVPDLLGDPLEAQLDLGPRLARFDREQETRSKLRALQAEGESLFAREHSTATPDADLARLEAIEAEMDRLREESERIDKEEREEDSRVFHRQILPPVNSLELPPYPRLTTETRRSLPLAPDWEKLRSFLVSTVTVSDAIDSRIIGRTREWTFRRIKPLHHGANSISLFGTFPERLDEAGTRFQHAEDDDSSEHFIEGPINAVVAGFVGERREAYAAAARPESKDKDVQRGHLLVLRQRAHADLEEIKRRLEPLLPYDYQVVIAHGRQGLLRNTRSKRGPLVYGAAEGRFMLNSRFGAGHYVENISRTDGLRAFFDELYRGGGVTYRHHPGPIEDTLFDISFLRIVPRLDGKTPAERETYMWSMQPLSGTASEGDPR